jgi:large subunit ribosomal protein L10
LAITKQQKQEMLETYVDWLKRSQAVILVEYTGARMKDLDSIRSRIRETGGEFHVVKNTLLRRAFKQQGLSVPDEHLLRSTAMSFAFSDPAATAKALAEAMRSLKFMKVKVGFMAGAMLDAAQVKALAELPPLPIVRAQLLGALQAPAGKLLRTIAEPARGLASVIRAHSEQAPAAA